MRVCLATIVATMMLTAPAVAQGAPAPRSGGFSLEDLSSKLAMVESISDLTSWFGPKPDPSPEFNYIEKRRFDMQLHQSLGAKLPIVNVRVDGAFQRDAMPERMSQWLTAVEKSGGTVRYCALQPEDRSILALLGVALKLSKKVDKWLLYKPAEGYDALIVTDASQGKVLNAAFTERGATSGCPDGTLDVGTGATD